jgi:hypothetical protein
VGLAVGLIVAAQVDAAHRDAPGDRVLPDARAHDLAVDDDLARLAHVHGRDARLHTHVA